MIANCEFLYKTQSKEYAMNITCDHNPFTQTHMLAHDCKHVRVIDLLACMYVQLSIVENESFLILSNYQPANTIAKPSTTVAQAVWYSINSHPTCSLTSHTSIAKIEGVTLLFGDLQSLELQSGSYSTIRNRLTRYSKPNLQ